MPGRPLDPAGFPVERAPSRPAEGRHLAGPALASSRWWLRAAIALTIFKLWLTRGQPVYAIGPAGHDDRLYLLLAESILQGDWLGVYSQMTLAKGAFYSIWVAAVFWTGVPLYLAQQLAYAGACALLVRACRPAIRHGALALAFYLLLLWNPMSYEMPTLGRVLRQNIYTPLGVAIFAGLVALYHRRQESFRRLAPWAVLLGLATGAFWLTREESIWLVPSMALLGGGALAGAFRASPAAFRNSVRALALALGCALLPLLLVAWANYRHYGWFGTVEMRADAFKDAYGAMLRVRVPPDRPFVPVSREAMNAMYAVSPTFAKLRPHFDGAIGLGWAEASAGVTNLPPSDRQIGGGWLVWALRDAVAAAGYCDSAAEALGFYRRMADELNAACDDGRLPAGPRRSGFLPPWRPGQAGEVARTFGEFADFLVSFKGFAAFTPPSIGGDDYLAIFRDLTAEPISLAPEATNPRMPRHAEMSERKVRILQGIGTVLRAVLLGAFVLAQAVALARVVQLAWRRELTYPIVLAAAAWGACFTYLLLNAIIQVTSFPVIAVSSFAPAYPLLLVFIYAALWDAAEGWFGRRPR